MPDRQKQYTVTLETLTPVFIGAGEHRVLSPYTDYVEEDQQVLILDPRKMEAALAEDPSLIDEFMQSIRSNMDNTPSTFSLASFIRNRLRKNPADLAAARLPIRGGKLGHNQIRRHIADAGRPFIPGSSIKGALRTAIFYAWLTRDEQGKKLLQQLAAKTEALWGEHHRALDEINELYEKDRYTARNKERQLRTKVTSALSFFKEEKLFGRLTDQNSSDFRGPDMRFFRVSDSSLLELSDLQITEIDRIKLREVQKVSPQWCEAIRPESTVTFQLSILRGFQTPFLQSLFSNGIESLSEVVRCFAKASIDYELETLKRHNEPGLQTVARFYRNELATRPTSPKQCLMRIGFGKTYFDNSIGLALYHHDREAFSQFRKLLGLGRNPKTKKLVEGRFPTTRSYAAHNAKPDVPLGWVEVVFHEGKVEGLLETAQKGKAPEPVDPEILEELKSRHEEATQYPEPIRPWILKARKPQNQLTQHADEWLSTLERLTPLDEPSITFFTKWMEKRWPGIMENPDKTKGKKKKPVYKPRQIEIAKRLIALRQRLEGGE